MPGAPGVRPGTELGRYTLGEQVEALSGGERRAARDTVLQRDVTLLLMPLDAPTTAAAVDAARRAAGIDATQLVRILDVGTEGDLAYVAEDQVTGSRTYGSLVDESGLPAEEVRRITGEVATGLEAARVRGLHHLALTPAAVLVGEDGRVAVRGTATAAALEDRESEGEEAAREDATALVALAYAGLTGTWPLPGDSGGVAAAARPGGVLPAPSEVAVGVPGDLDTICRETLRDDAGPESPGDLAAQIAPWSRIPLSGAARPGEAATVPVPVGDLNAAEHADHGAPVDRTLAGPGRGTEPWSDDAGEGRSSQGADLVEVDETPTTVIPRLRREDLYRGGDQGDHTYQDDEGDQDPGEPGGGEPRPARGRQAAAAAVAGGVLGAAASGTRDVGHRLGSMARHAGERSRDAVVDQRARRAALREDDRRSESLGAAPADVDVEPPAPLLPAGTGEPPTRRQTSVVLAAMTAFVVAALVVALVGVSRIGSNSDLGAILGSDQTALPTDTPSSTTASGSREPLGVIGAIGYDPTGDGVEHNAEAQRVYDGDAGTAWTSEGYEDTSIAGKPGVGLVVDLGQPQRISEVTIILPNASEATVYAGDSPTNEGEVIGQSNGRTGELTLDAPQPVEGQFVTVWFTSTALGGDGRYRASLAEIVVR